MRSLNMLSNYICALDISSSKIAACVAKVKKSNITDIFFSSVPTNGIKRGVIINSVDLVGSISRILKNLKTKSGINIKYIHTNISGQDIVTKHSRAIIPLAERGNKVITLSDIKKANEQARILGSNLEEEIIHQIPFSYTIDSKSDVINPLGLYGHALEVDLYLICGKLSSIQSLARVINQAGHEIKKIFLSGLATSEVVFDKRLKEGINILCDIGSDISELLIFRDGLLKDVEILPLGGDDLSAQLSDTLKIPFDLAEDIKKSYGMIGNYEEIKEDKEILLKKDNIYKPIKQKFVSEIITSKAKLICQAIKDALDKKIELSTVNNFLTVGSTVLLEGFIEMLENTLGTSVKLGRINNQYIISQENSKDLSGQKYLNYITCLGIICEVLKGSKAQNILTSQPTLNPLLNAINRFKEVYQEYF